MKFPPLLISLAMIIAMRKTFSAQAARIAEAPQATAIREEPAVVAAAQVTPASTDRRNDEEELVLVHNHVVVSTEIMVEESITSNAERTNEVEKEQEGEKVSSLCLTEKGLDLHGGSLVMANTDNFQEESFSQCVQFCMEAAPELNHVLISYYNALIVGDKFNCMCAGDSAISNTTRLLATKCDVDCPLSNYKCGNAKKDTLSAYCIHRDCSIQSDLAANQPICARRLPHDAHGCVKHNFIDWSYAHNVRNFSMEENNDASCIWECRDSHLGSLFALTRVVDNVLTCSCGFPGSFNLDKLVSPTFCHMGGGHQEADLGYYNVNCVTDLDEDGGDTNTPNGETACDSVGPVGCLYEDALTIMDSTKINQLQIDITKSDFPDVTLCLRGCLSVWPNSLFAAIRHKSSIDSQTLDCRCLGSNAFNASTLGPDAKCNQFCGDESLGLLCGGQSGDGISSLSLYCLASNWMEEEESKERVQRDLEKGKNVNNLAEEESTKPLLEEIAENLRQASLRTDILVGLLTLLCIILVTAIVYLCYTRGIASLSRYVM